MGGGGGGGGGAGYCWSTKHRTIVRKVDVKAVEQERKKSSLAEHDCVSASSLLHSLNGSGVANFDLYS